MGALVNVYPPEQIRKRIQTYINSVTPPLFDQAKLDNLTHLFGKILTSRPEWDPNHAGIMLGWLLLPDSVPMYPLPPDSLDSVSVDALLDWSVTDKDGFELEVHQVCTRAIYDYRRTTAYAALKKPNFLSVIIDGVNTDFGPVQMETDSILASTIRAGGITTAEYDKDAPPPVLAGLVNLSKVVNDLAGKTTVNKKPVPVATDVFTKIAKELENKKHTRPVIIPMVQDDLPDIDNIVPAPKAKQDKEKKQLFYLK